MRFPSNSRLLPFAFLVLAAACASPRNPDLVATEVELAVRRLEADVQWLAADEQEGRRAGTPAGLRAGEWIAQRQAAVLCAMEDVKACAVADNGARYRIVVQPDGQPPAGQLFAAQAASNAA